MNLRVRGGASRIVAFVCAIAVAPSVTRATAAQTPDPDVAQPSDSTRVTEEFRGFLFGKGAWAMHEPREVGEALVIAQAEGRIEIRSRVVLAAVLRLRSESRLQPNTVTELELREAHFGYRSHLWQIALGRQQVVWGKADGLRVLDMVNPLDLREFVLDDYSRNRIPLWIVNGELFKGSNVLQVLVIPDERQNLKPELDGRFALALPLQVPPSLTLPALDRPSMREAGNWQYGAKWESRLGRAGYTANVFRTWTDEPVWFATTGPAAPALQRRIVRQNFLGGSWDVPWGTTVVRGEFTLTPNGYARTLRPDGLISFVEHTQLESVVGIDWIAGRWTVSPQVFHGRTFEASDLVDNRQRTLLTLLIDVSGWQDRVTFKTFGVLGANNGDWWIAPKATYDAGNSLELTVGVDLFRGPAFSPLGQFNRQSRFMLQAQWRFDRRIDHNP